MISKPINRFFKRELKSIMNKPNIASFFNDYKDKQILKKISKNVTKKVGIDVFRKIKKLDVVIFPNKLPTAKNLYDKIYVIEKIFSICGITPKQFTPFRIYDICLNFQDLTFNQINSENYINQSYKYMKINPNNKKHININFNCNDISKNKIDKIHKLSFGYGININPLKYIGNSVCKSNDNSTHDGEVVKCPITNNKIKKNVVYNLLVNNYKKKYIIDFRLIYIGGLLDFFYEKKRPLSSRFSNINKSVIIRKTKNEFTSSEISKIEKFIRCLNAEYGEIDVLRDQETRKIYVCDFSKTPAGPPNGLPKNLYNEALEKMSVAFIKNIANKLIE